MEGHILGNRYELIEKIGGGGMALVYKAKCKLLNRFVAVKLLRSEFSNDEEFVKRFRIEAQAAASLSHPNIVSIYDVGNDGNIQYIVMEYIDGITLKECIDKKGALSWREAVNISIQICSAIEHAHRNHIVHRDIKPHNILLTKDGIAKVTDFGIARAVSSSTITMVGSTIGSVHYFSPEQARGGFIDEKSDMYSLGITLYEMVTGRLPFDAETPVAVALKHIQVDAEPPIEVRDDVPKGVNDIILKAIKKEQNKRYQTAHDMLEDLHRVLKEPLGGFVTDEEAEDCPTRRIKTIGGENLTKREDYIIKEKNTKKSSKRKDRLTYWIAGVTSLVVIAICFYIGFSIVFSQPNDPENDFVVGDYVGSDIDAVKAQLPEGLEPIIEEQPDDEAEAGTIIRQDPDPNKTIVVGGDYPLKLVVSSGKEMIEIKDYLGKDPRLVENELQNIGFLTTRELEFSEEIAVNQVTRTEPAAYEEVKPGETITVFVSKGPEIKKTKVPDLMNLKMSQAKLLLENLKLKLGVVHPEDSSTDVYRIVKQKPAAGKEVDENTAVEIWLENDISQIKYQSDRIELDIPDNYGDEIIVRVEVTPSTTNKTVRLINDETYSKYDFPIPIDRIPVPASGTTRVRVFLKDALNDTNFTLYEEYTMTPSGR